MNYVNTVYVSENNGIATPAGAYVGMDASYITKLYGEPDFISKDKSYPYYAYRCGNESLLFNINKRSGKVFSIVITKRR